ncbi:MAG: copper chaperone PCu(A)C [Roseivivax sp.]|nr:copper chaperone PCu(A)C [Roseivivax sp.]
MTYKTVLAALMAATLAMPAFAEIKVSDPYARASTAMATSGAAFLVIENTGPEDDRLIAARSDIADRVELHTHKEDANGVMQMLEVKEGFAVPAGASHALARGGDHLMFLGLKRPMEHGATVAVTLTFEKAGEMAIEIPVDLERRPMHGQMKMGN